MNKLLHPMAVMLLVYLAGIQSATAGYMKSDSDGWANRDHGSFWSQSWLKTADGDAAPSKKKKRDRLFINTALPRHNDRSWIGFDFGRMQDDNKKAKKLAKNKRKSKYDSVRVNKRNGGKKKNRHNDHHIGHLFRDQRWHPRADWDDKHNVNISIDASQLLYLFLAIKHDIKNDKDYGWFFDLIKKWKQKKFDAFCAKYGDKFSKCDNNMPPVPVPAAVWLFTSGLLGLGALARANGRKKSA